MHSIFIFLNIGRRQGRDGTCRTKLELFSARTRRNTAIKSENTAVRATASFQYENERQPQAIDAPAAVLRMGISEFLRKRFENAMKYRCKPLPHPAEVSSVTQE